MTAVPIEFREQDPLVPVAYSYWLEEILFQARTEYQQIMVGRSRYFGKMLILDGVVQFTERDEFFYHEMLAHVALHAHPSASRVAIIGGGDGGTLREVLKHNSVRQVSVIELDPGVIEAARRFFPDLAAGFSDRRTTVVQSDGAAFIASLRAQFDVILVDSTDPVGPGTSLFQPAFYASASAALRDDGILVAQTESLHFHRELIARVQGELARVFPLVDLYAVPLATYAGNWWTFSTASKAHNPRLMARAHTVSCRYYSEEVHAHAFLPPGLLARVRNGLLSW